MTTKSTAVTSLLLRKDKLTPDEWESILEHFRAQLVPLLSRMTTDTVGDFECLERYSTLEKLGTGNASAFVSNSEYHLSLRGVFFQHSRYQEHPDVRHREAGEHIQYIWGLSKNGSWVLTTVDIKTKKNDSRFPNFDAPTRISIRDTTPAEICLRVQITPQQILATLKSQLESWSLRTRKLFEKIENIDDEMGNTITALSLIET
jgi:hypothetical protein